MAQLSILFAPSYEKKTGGNEFAPDMFDYRNTSNTFNYFSDLNTERRTLIDRLIACLKEGVDVPEPLDRPREADAMRKVYSSPLMSALRRYSPGVMYAALDFPGLPTGAQRRLLENGVIVSSLFGLLRPDDLIPEYYLPMDVHVPELGKVASYWRPIISPILNGLLSDRVVWDLLPDSYRAAWDDDGSYQAKASVQFLGRRGEDLPEHELAHLVGKLANHVAKDTSYTWDPALSWKPPMGFRLSEERSTLEGSNPVIVFNRR